MQVRRKVGIVGAGIAGITSAKTLFETNGFDVEIFEKSRGAGGRIATRRSEQGNFDHGAQYFTVRSEIFRAKGTIEEWKGTFCVLNQEKGTMEPTKESLVRYVGVPGMSSIVKEESKELKISYETRITSIHKINDKLSLEDEKGTLYSDFDYIIISTPAPQTLPLIKPLSSTLYEVASMAKISPCWCVMVSLGASLGLPFDGSFVNDSPLSWIANNTKKPGRSGNSTECWVLHGSPKWSEEHLEESPEQVIASLLAAFEKVVGVDLKKKQLISSVAHRYFLWLTDFQRWRYSIPVEPLKEASYFDPSAKIGICGDWCSESRIEGAYLSGISAAKILISNVEKLDSKL